MDVDDDPSGKGGQDPQDATDSKPGGLRRGRTLAAACGILLVVAGIAAAAIVAGVSSGHKTSPSGSGETVSKFSVGNGPTILEKALIEAANNKSSPPSTSTNTSKWDSTTKSGTTTTQASAGSSGMDYR